MAHGAWRQSHGANPMLCMCHLQTLKDLLKRQRESGDREQQEKKARYDELVAENARISAENTKNSAENTKNAKLVMTFKDVSGVGVVQSRARAVQCSASGPAAVTAHAHAHVMSATAQLPQSRNVCAGLLGAGKCDRGHDVPRPQKHRDVPHHPLIGESMFAVVLFIECSFIARIA